MHLVALSCWTKRGIWLSKEKKNRKKIKICALDNEIVVKNNTREPRTNLILFQFLPLLKLD